MLRIQRLDPLKATPSEKGQEPYVNYIGLNFARFKIITLARQDGVLMASIEISSDEIPRKIEESMEKKDLIATLKRELKLYYECVLKGAEVEARTERLDSETSIHKMVYQTATGLDLPVAQKLSFLQMDSVEEKIELLVRLLRGKTEKSKGMVSIEGRVKEAMGIGQKSAGSSFRNTLGLTDAKNGVEARIKGKKLPEQVRSVIEKEMKQLEKIKFKQVVLPPRSKRRSSRPSSTR